MMATIRRSRSRSRLERAGVLSTCAAALLILAANRAVADPSSRPFSATVEGNASPVFTGPCSIVNDETATGYALHMGAIELFTHEVVDVDPCSNPPSRGLINGEFVMTAANGDQVVGVYQTVVSFDFVANQISAAGSFTITGGTGRFAGASGGGNVTAMGSLSPPFGVTAGFFGTIGY